MKKLKIYIFMLLVSFLVFGFLFFVFYNDPFIKLAPENTKIYSLINTRQKIKEEDAKKIFSLRNISINKVLESNEFKKIKSDYISKISIFVTDDNNLYIVLKQKIFKKNAYDFDSKSISEDINKYTNLNIELKTYKFDRYVVLTNDKNAENLLKHKYKFFVSNYMKLISEREFGFILSQSLLKTYANSFYLNNEIKNLTGDFFNNYFIKDYSLTEVKIINSNFNVSISNLKGGDTTNNYSVKYLKDNYLIVNNINLSKTIVSFIDNYKTKQIKSSENLNYLFKNISEDGFNINNIKDIFSNNSSVFLNFKDSNISLDNLDSFLILTKLENFNNYVNDITNLENIFLRKASLNNPKLQTVVLPDGTVAKEEVLDYDGIKFKTENSTNSSMNYIIKYLEYDKNKIYYSMLNKDGILLISNNKEMINSVYNKFTEYSFLLNNLNINILANVKQNKFNMTIK